MKKTFEQWMKQVDLECAAKCGMSIYDIPDCPFRDWFDEGKSPKAAASKAIKMMDE